MGTAGSAGYDIFEANDVLIRTHGRVLIPTDLAALRAELDVKAGVIDTDYRGHIRAVLKNDTQRSYQVTQLDKNAHLVLDPYCNALKP